MSLDLDREHFARSYYTFLQEAWEHANERETFVGSWHLEQMCLDAEAMADFRLSDLVYNVPPGSGKSSVFSTFYPAWVWATRDAGRHFMYASFDLSLLNNASEKMITLIKSEWYQARWPHVRLASDAHRETKTTAGGARYNTTFRGGGTGRHAHHQIIDDPIKPKDVAGGSFVTQTELNHAWRTIHDTLATRKKDPYRFTRMLVMQRLHEDDPAGRAIKEGWTPRVFPLVFDARTADPKDRRTVDGAQALESKDFDAIPRSAMLTRRWGPELVQDEIIRLGGWGPFSTQCQQLPSAAGGEIIKAQWIDAYTYDPRHLLPILAQAKAAVWAQSWDFAFKKTETSDFISGGWWCARFERDAKTQKILPHFYLMPFPYFDRATFTECKQVMRTKKIMWPSSEIYVEDKANGSAIEDELRSEFSGRIKMVEPRGSKVIRLTARTGLFERGQVHLPECPDLERIKTTLTRFPNVKHDDEVDMISQALGEIARSALFVAAMDRAKSLLHGQQSQRFSLNFGRGR